MIRVQYLRVISTFTCIAHVSYMYILDVHNTLYYPYIIRIHFYSFLCYCKTLNQLSLSSGLYQEE